MSGMHASCALLYRYDAVVEIRDSLTVDLAERKETIKAMHQAEVANLRAELKAATDEARYRVTRLQGSKATRPKCYDPDGSGHPSVR